MSDLAAIYNAFEADEPLPVADDPRYVDLSKVRFENQVVQRLARKIQNAGSGESHCLLGGHTKCGKTTELNRVAFQLREDGYATVYFDVAEAATRTFEYTTVLLMMAGQTVAQLAKLERREKKKIKIVAASAKKLVEFLRSHEVKIGNKLSGDVTGKAEVKINSGLFGILFGESGLGAELRGGFERSREITTKIEMDTNGFLEAIKKIIEEARNKTREAGYKDLVIICDGCDKLALTATDGSGKSHDLQQALFVDHQGDLRSIPSHVIYTVPISIAANLGDIWEDSTEYVSAIPVSELPDIEEQTALEGRQALREVVKRRLDQHGTTIDGLFDSPDLLERLIDASGGHISDLLLMVRDAVLEAQVGAAGSIFERHVRNSVRNRAREYTRLIESKYLEILQAIDRAKTPLANNDLYREILFKRLALEYQCNTGTRVDLHPLVKASGTYQQYTNP
jgi:hypothetical protein